ncbi:MAG: hypothetical protein WC290_02485 [archaeon]|jgi:hypothetical protein
MNLIEYVKAFFTSRDDILSIINSNVSYQNIITFIFAVFLISVPTTFQIYNYVFNIILLGISISLITLLSSYLISMLNKKDLFNTFLGNLNFVSFIVFCNVFIILLMYLIGLPFNASSILISVAATLISTYYFIVILTYSFSLQIKQCKMRKLYEILILALWFFFVFLILPLTI